MSANLKLITKPDPEPPPELIEKMLDLAVHCEMYEFAYAMETARAYWRRHRDLVEAPEFPEPFRAHFVKEYDREPDDNFCNEDVDVFDPNLRENLRPLAREWALRRMHAP